MQVRLFRNQMTVRCSTMQSGLPLDERELLQQHIERLLQRAREMEHAITTIAVTL